MLTYGFDGGGMLIMVTKKEKQKLFQTEGKLAELLKYTDMWLA